METRVQEMRKKAKEAEDWQRTKGRIYETLIPFAVGLVMCAAGTYFYYVKSQ